MGSRLDRTLTAAAALLLAGLGFLPLANWISGGHQADWYGVVTSEWLSGSAIALGVGVVAALSARRFPGLGRIRPLAAVQRSAEAAPQAWAAALVLAALLLYLATARVVLDGRPLLIDEIVQVFQARIFARGRPWIPAPLHPEFFSSMHLIDEGGRVYGQFPAGGPAMLIPGVWVGLEWVTGPVFGALSALLFVLLARRIEPRPGLALFASGLFAFAPFAVFMSGSYMNHVTSLTWILVGMLGLARAVGTREDRVLNGALTGLGFGIAATIRPLDAVAFALPAGVWLLVRAVRERQVRTLLAAGIALAPPLAMLLGINAATTGAPFRFGYTVMWGRAHDLGFHATPWGDVHTPVRGLELLNLYFLRLQTYLFESALPSLAPAILALALTRRLAAFDRYLLSAAALLCGIYFAYWHDGFYLGPRFMFPLLPALALWTARAVPAVRARWPGELAGPIAASALAISLAIGAVNAVAIRGPEYRSGMQSGRWDADRAARAAGIRGSLILVRESWGAQVIARMWGVGVPRGDAEEIYRRVDTCLLDQELAALEREGTRGSTAVARMHRLLADSLRVVKTTFSPDPTERVLVGLRYPEACLQRIREDWQGFTLYSSMLLAGKGGNVFARDLHGRDSLLLAQYPGRPIFLLRRGSWRLASPLQFDPVDPDSLRRAWARGE